MDLLHNIVMEDKFYEKIQKTEAAEKSQPYKEMKATSTITISS